MSRCRSPKPLLLALLLCALPLLPGALAYIDLVSPAQGAVSNAVNQTFEYYPSLPGVQSCTLSVDSQSFPDTTIANNAFNTFTVVNIASGSHTWRVACENGTATELSVIRELAVDRSPPSLTLLAPSEGATVTDARVTLLATDNLATSLQCAVNANALLAATATVANGSTATIPVSLADGSYQLLVTCVDAASNAASALRNITVSAPPPPLSLGLSLSKRNYSLGEQVLLTIDTLPGANVSIEVCPDEQGFVQCYTPLVTGSFPQTMVLPYTNRTGAYLVDGVALHLNRSASASTSYLVENTMSVAVSADREPSLDEQFTLSASATGMIGAVTYTWSLSNGTTLIGQQAKLLYTTLGSRTERVTATDSAGNNATASYSVDIQPEYAVTVSVTSGADGATLPNATVQIRKKGASSSESETRTTDVDGKALFTLLPETYELFVSKEGYRYLLQERKIEAEATIAVALEPYDYTKPVVTLLSPAEGSEAALPVQVRYRTEDAGTLACTVSYAKEGEQWLQQSGTQQTQAGTESSFSLDALQEARYTVTVSCEDGNGNVGESAPRNFTVVQASRDEEGQPDLASLGFGDDPLAVIDRAYGAYDSFDAQQREAADLLGWEGLIKQQKKVIARAARDLDALRFQRDLDEAERQAKSSELEARIAEAQRAVPMDLAILETRSAVSYPKEEELQALLPEVKRLKGYSLPDKQLLAYLQLLQQGITTETELLRARMLMADGSEQPVSIVSRSFRYKLSGTGSAGTAEPGSGEQTGFSDSSDYSILELLPEAAAPDASVIVAIQETETLSQRPVALEFRPEQRITYYLARDVPLDTLAGAQALLLKRPTASDLEGISGNATLFGLGMAIGWELGLLLAFLVVLLLFLFRRDLLRRLRYLLYAESAKRPLHEVRTIINDGMAHAEAGDLERAMMRYKEAKLAYERLSRYAKNESYPLLIELQQALDSAYFSALAHRIGDAVEEGRYEEAIDDFARLEGTFGLLAPEEQERLILIVNSLAAKLGLVADGVQSAGSGAAASDAGERMRVVRERSDRAVSNAPNTVSATGGAP